MGLIVDTHKRGLRKGEVFRIYTKSDDFGFEFDELNTTRDRYPAVLATTIEFYFYNSFTLQLTLRD